jgi:anti-sigma-K factor RskA
MAHDQFEDAVASYAIDALDPTDRRAFEAHLSTCARCQAELAELRRVVAGIGMATEPVAPPAALKARTIAYATGRSADARAPASAPARPVPVPMPKPSPRLQIMPWLVAAAAVVIAVASGLYALSLRSRISALEQIATAASAQAERLRKELISLRSNSEVLTQTVRIISAPDVRHVILKGQGTAPDATGRAVWSPANGLVFNAEQLPSITPDRVYQLWVIVDGKPVGLTTFRPATNGSASVIVPLPAGIGTPKAVAVTNEPAPNGSPAPTSPILLVGSQ